MNSYFIKEFLFFKNQNKLFQLKKITYIFQKIYISILINTLKENSKKDNTKTDNSKQNLKNKIFIMNVKKITIILMIPYWTKIE